MTSLSHDRKKKKITLTASKELIDKAENALIRLGFESKQNLAQSQLISRNTVTKFFQGQPIQIDSLRRICEALKLNLQDFLPREKHAPISKIDEFSTSKFSKEEGAVQTGFRQITIMDSLSNTNKVVITLQGNINSLENEKIILKILQEYSGHSITITDIQSGSIRLFIDGSPEDIEKLVNRIQLKELTELEGFPIENVQYDKWYLVEKIKTQGVVRQKLSHTDLSEADLSGANLFLADLSNADLSEADLSGTDLNYANLSEANLSGVNLSGANLIGANLIGTDLSDVNWGNNLYLAKKTVQFICSTIGSVIGLVIGSLIGNRVFSLIGLAIGSVIGSAIGSQLNRTLISRNSSFPKVKNAEFGNNLGISSKLKKDLINQGARFVYESVYKPYYVSDSALQTEVQKDEKQEKSKKSG